jgi:demethylmenaquinone methyltransferase/2-methoxy-6-polyprenyl-1,4-benzoquinol methylase
MANVNGKPITRGREFAEGNRTMFDGVARRYDLLNSLLSLGRDRSWRRKAVSALNPEAGERFLDLGSGTADIALEVLRQEPGASVLGVDPAVEMLALGRKKIQERGLEERIELQKGDATRLDLPDRDFDGAISAFCLRNLTDRLQMFEETWRVLRPGGRVVALELTRPQNPVLRQGHRLYNHLVVPLLGRLLSQGDAYRYLVDSIEEFPRRQEVRQELQEAGFSQVSHQSLTFGVVTVFFGRR